MGGFNLELFVGELEKILSDKTGRLSLALQGVGWQSDFTCLNGDDPATGKEVDDIVRSTRKRAEFEQKQYRMLFEDIDTTREAVNKRIYLSAINWSLGLHLVTSDWRDGVRLLLKSTELLDMSYGIVEHETWLQAETEKKERATNGGKAKAALYTPIKAEVIRLLLSKKPEEGWKSKNAALNAIDKDICLFIEQCDFPGVSGDLNMQKDPADVFTRIPRLISDWSRNDADVKAAFESTIRRKKKSAPKGAE